MQNNGPINVYIWPLGPGNEVIYRSHPWKLLGYGMFVWKDSLHYVFLNAPLEQAFYLAVKEWRFWSETNVN